MPLCLFLCRSWRKSNKGQTYANSHTPTLATLLRRQAMRLSQSCTPVPSTYRQHAQLRDDDGGADGGRDFFGGLDPQANMSFGVTNDDDSLEASALTSAGLFLYGLDLFHPHQRQHHDLPPPNQYFHKPQPSTHKTPSSSSKKVSHTFITSSFSFGRNQSTI